MQFAAAVLLTAVVFGVTLTEENPFTGNVLYLFDACMSRSPLLVFLPFIATLPCGYRFIDEYMKDANDAQLKVYLYLLRMMSANLATSVSEIADKFNHTEKDVIRALKYWEKAQKEFAAILDAKIINFDCGHYIHHFKSDEMCKEIIKFVNSLER